MGLVVSAEETKHNLDFEIRRESVMFYGDESDDIRLFAYGDDCVEIDKVYLKKILSLLQDEKWYQKIFGIKFVKQQNDPPFYYIRNNVYGTFAYGGSGFYPTFVPFENLDRYDGKGLFSESAAEFYIKEMKEWGFYYSDVYDIELIPAKDIKQAR